MQKKLIGKILAILVVMAVIGVSLAMVQSTVSERMAFRAEAARSIAEDSVGEQRILGPVLVVPYTEEYKVSKKSGSGEDESRTERIEARMLVFPNQMSVDGSFGTERRYRGIHQVLVFDGQHRFTGNFAVPSVNALPRTHASSALTVGQPFISLAISDVRGMRDIPRLRWGGREIEFEQGSGLHAFSAGVHADIAPRDIDGASIAFSFQLNLSGMDRQSFVPLARNNTLTFKSAWQHPQFTGRFLPVRRTVGDDGFSAEWKVSSLASAAQRQIRDIEERKAATADRAVESFQIGFIEPVNIYSMADRATKYGLLFVTLTFAAFFLFEILKRLPIHPVQYGLVGLSLTMFFLLLLSLSEHMAFLYAYLAASAACILLIAFYLAHVLGNWRRGVGFGLSLSTLYGILYGLLNSENNALVMGALLMFAVLAAIMIATRRVNWYQLGSEPV